MCANLIYTLSYSWESRSSWEICSCASDSTLPERGAHHGGRTEDLQQHPLGRVALGWVALALTSPSSSHIGNREEEQQWGRRGIPSWGFQRWRIWSCCCFGETRGFEDTSSPPREPGGGTMETWETARGRGEDLPWNLAVGDWSVEILEDGGKENKPF